MFPLQSPPHPNQSMPPVFATLSVAVLAQGFFGTRLVRDPRHYLYSGPLGFTRGCDERAMGKLLKSKRPTGRKPVRSATVTTQGGTPYTPGKQQTKALRRNSSRSGKGPGQNTPPGSQKEKN